VPVARGLGRLLSLVRYSLGPRKPFTDPQRVWEGIYAPVKGALDTLSDVVCRMLRRLDDFIELLNRLHLGPFMGTKNL
jgi:hypothetical protein